MFLLCHVFTLDHPLLTPNLVTTMLAIPPCMVLAPMQLNLYHVRILVGCRFGNGATISDLRCHDKTKSLLWVHTQGCAARHALVSRFLVMIHCRTTPMCYFHVSSSLVISPYHVKRSICRTRCNRTSF